ncbi:MAG TPA: ATP-binding protein, partial [Stellaceae bacterium]
GGLGFSLALPPALPRVRADEQRLKQILLNLLSNAVKFTPAGGRVALLVSLAPDGSLALAVSDTGIGMKPHEIPIAMEPFRQIDSTLTRRYEGTGLGLPLARTLTELHGGSLTIKSAHGKGTTVTVLLPASRVEAAHDGIEPSAVPAE